ncbi:MAG: hypothetical protein R3A52_15960 [Polyangiales bacterium]
MPPVAHIVVRARGVRVEAGANDAPFLRHAALVPVSLQYPLNAFVLPEDNRLTAQVSPLDDEDAEPGLDLALTGPDPASAALLRVSWSLPRGAAFEPFTLSLPFIPPEAVETTLWSEGEVVDDLDDAALDGARALCAELVSAFARRDIDAVSALLDFRTREMAAAYEWDLDEHRAEVRETFQGMMDDPGYALAPVDVATLRFTPCGDGRALHVSRADDGELIGIRSAGSDEEQTMQVYVGRFGDRWRIVR